MNEDGIRATQTAAAEFRSALAKGTGRATLLLRRDPHSPELNAGLLHACNKTLVYDPQCEAERAPYLCKLIEITGQHESYRESIARHLWAAGADRFWDVQQMFGILVQLAAQDETACAVLRDFVLTACSANLFGAVMPALVRLQGLCAFLACVHRFGPAKDWMLIPEMTWALEQRDGTEAARSALREARKADGALDRRMRSVENKASSPRAPDAPPSEADAPRRFPANWIKGASEEDLARAARHLVAETDDERLFAYLAIFQRRSFPGDPTRLFPLIASPNRRVAALTAGVLGRVSHPAIRDLALRMIADGRFGVGADLLRSSYGPGDLVLLKTLLERLAADAFDYHDVAFSTLDLIEGMADKPKEARAVLLHLYEHDPCSNCRRRVVLQLAEAGGIPDWMAEEARYDADPSIAERFRPPAVG